MHSFKHELNHDTNMRHPKQLHNIHTLRHMASYKHVFSQHLSSHLSNRNVCLQRDTLARYPSILGSHVANHNLPFSKSSPRTHFLSSVTWTSKFLLFSMMMLCTGFTVLLWCSGVPSALNSKHVLAWCVLHYLNISSDNSFPLKHGSTSNNSFSRQVSAPKRA